MKPESSQKTIGMQNERSLHNAIKKWYYRKGDKFERKVDKYFIDIVRKDLLIEVQTRNFFAIKKKLEELLKSHKVRLVYPIACEKWIVKLKNSKTASRRKSPKTGTIFDIFKELINIRDIVSSASFSLEILLIAEEQIRTDDGKGSWRRKGVSITDRKLLAVKERIELNTKSDYLIFVPGSTGFSGIRSDAVSPAARIMPLLSIPKILAGCRFTTTTTLFPVISSGV